MRRGCAHAPPTMAPQVRNRLENGLAYSAVEYLEALRWRGPALAAHLAAIGDVDVVIAPASRAVAPTIEETDVGGAPNAEAVIQAITRFMRPVNYLGLPVLVMPAGRSQQRPADRAAADRPSVRRRDAHCARRAFQAATDHHRRMPTLP